MQKPPRRRCERVVNGSKLPCLSLIPKQALGAHKPNTPLWKVAPGRVSFRLENTPSLVPLHVNDFLLFLSLCLTLVSFNVIVFGALLFYPGHLLQSKFEFHKITAS